MPTLYYTDYSSPDLTQQRVIAAFLNTNLSLQQIPTKYPHLNLADENNFLLHQANAISIYLASESKLLGEGFEEEIEVYSWLEYFNVQIHPLLNQVYAQIFGKATISQKKYNYANEELKRVLKVLDDKLRLRTYVVGNNLTLVDLILCCQIEKAFRLILTADIRKKLTNLTRWFTFIRNLKPFLDCVGLMFLCEVPFKLNFSTQSEQNPTQKIENKEGMKKQESSKQKKEEEKIEKQQKKKKQTKKQQQNSKKEEQKQQQKQQKQPQNEQEQKDNKFSLDGFKRSFQNTQNKQTVINELLNNFPEGFSIWKVYYSKDVTQGKVDYLTSNLAKGTLQRLDALRKTGFGNWGVYHNQADKQYEIRGVMFWKGDEIAPAWKEHPSFEYHIFLKLDPRNPSDQQIIKSYWLQMQKSEGLTLYDTFKLI